MYPPTRYHWLVNTVRTGKARLPKLLSAYGTCCLILIAVLRPITDSHWLGDDWPNSQQPHWDAWRYGDTSFRRIIISTWNSIQGWMFDQGRLYVFSRLEANLLFYYLPDLHLYKLTQLLGNLLTLLIAAWFVYLLGQSHRITMMFILIMAITVQFRRDFDPHLAFSLLVPSMMLKLLLSSVAFYFAARSNQRLIRVALSILASLTYFASMSTYEHAFALVAVPAIAIIVGNSHGLKAKRPRFILLSLLLTWLAYLWIVFFFLRARAEGVIPRYELQVEYKSLLIFVSQLFAPVPLMVFDLKSDLIGNEKFAVAVLSSVACLFLFGQARRLRAWEEAGSWPSSLKTISTLGLWSLGLVLLIVPGVLLAIRPLSFEASRFTGIQPRFTYLHIFISQLGAALIIALAVGLFLERSRLLARDRLIQIGMFCYTVILMLTVSHNYAVAKETRNRELNYESWNALHKDGYLFKKMESGDGAISQTVNFAYETNPGNFYSRSGIRLTGIYYFVPGYLYSESEIQCWGEQKCLLPDLRSRITTQLSNSIVTDSENKFEKLRSGYGPAEAGDWVQQSLRPDRVMSSKLWIFDLYPVSGSTFVAFTVPLHSDQLEVDLAELRFVQLVRLSSDGPQESLKPSLAGVCLTEVPKSQRIAGTADFPLIMTFWKFPSGSGVRSYSELGYGTC